MNAVKSYESRCITLFIPCLHHLDTTGGLQWLGSIVLATGLTISCIAVLYEYNHSSMMLSDDLMFILEDMRIEPSKGYFMRLWNQMICNLYLNAMGIREINAMGWYSKNEALKE